MGWLFGNKTSMVTREDALPGRPQTMPVPARHAVLDAPLAPPYPDGIEAGDFSPEGFSVPVAVSGIAPFGYRHSRLWFSVPNGYCGIGGTNVKLGDP